LIQIQGPKEAATLGRVFPRRRHAYGCKVSGERACCGRPVRPDIAALADGRHVVAGTKFDFPTDRAGRSIRAGFFNADGSAFRPEFQVSTTTTDDQKHAGITALADGGSVVTWSDCNLPSHDPFPSAIRAQIFSADGLPSGRVFVVKTTTDGWQTDPTVGTLADGRSVVT